MTEKKKKHKVRSLIYRAFLILIAGLTVGLGVYSWNANRVVGNQLPMPFGVGASVVLSGSMEPTLKVNDLVFITESDTYEVGDIVVYQSENQLIIHRIKSISDDKIITQGDANNIADSPIYPNQIKGKFVFRIPIIGFVFKMLKTVPGTLCVLVLVVFLMYRSRRKERKKGDEDLEKIVAEIRALQAQQNAVTDDTVHEQSGDAADEGIDNKESSLPPADNADQRSIDEPDVPADMIEKSDF